MLLFKTKTVLAAMAILLFAGGGALAATGGYIPVISESFGSDDSVNEDAYKNHGDYVSTVARDKDAVGTKTNPNGKVIENHGQAVREAAHQKEHKDSGNNGDDASIDSVDDVSGDVNKEDATSGGNGNAYGHANKEKPKNNANHGSGGGDSASG